MMKVFVTGVNGQLGQEVAAILTRKGHTVISSDKDSMDLSQPENIENFFTQFPDAIVHCAAFTAVDKAEDEEQLCMNVNYRSTSKLCDVARKADIPFVFISTDYVFDGTKQGMYITEDATCPVNVYGRSKQLAEEYVLKYPKSFVLRTSWVFGKGNNFVKTMLKLAQQGKKQLNVVCDQVGSPTYAYDLATAICSMLFTDKYGLYHVTNENFCSWYEFARQIFTEAGYDVEVLPVTSDQYPTRAKRPLNSRLDKSKLYTNGFAPLPTWQDALSRYIEFLKKEGECR